MLTNQNQKFAYSAVVITQMTVEQQTGAYDTAKWHAKNTVGE